MNLKTAFLPAFFLLCQYGFSRVNDHFSEGDLTLNPVWSGDDALCEVPSGELHLKDGTPSPVIESYSYIVTESSFLNNATWDFYVRLTFNPSPGNQLSVYLASDQSDLTGSLNGYFVRIGNTDDKIILYSQNAASVTEIIDLANDIVNVSTPVVRVKVIRDENENRALLKDAKGGTSYVSERIVNDLTHLSTNYFGFLCDCTTTRADSFYVDEVLIYKPLEADSVIVNTSTEITIDPDQFVKKTEAEEITNYMITGGSSLSNVAIPDVQRDLTDFSKVNLAITPLYTGGFTTMVNNVKDSITESSISGLAAEFSYLQLQPESLFILPGTEIQLTFNDDLDPLAAEDESNFSIDSGIGQPVAATLDAVDPGIVSLKLSNSFFEGTTFQLALSRIQNEIQNSTLSDTEDLTFVIPLVVDSAYVVSETGLAVEFNKILDETLAETSSNYTVDGSVGNPNSAVLRADPKSVLLTFDAAFNTGDFSMVVSNLEDTNGYIIDTGGNSADFSYRRLETLSVSQVDESSIKVTLNQTLETSSAEAVTNYALTETGGPIDATYQASDSSVTLSFSRLHNAVYYLTITGVKNEPGTAQAMGYNDSLEISVTLPTESRAVIISELLPDPTPVVGLPDAEYVELYNVSASSLNLEGFSLNDETLPRYILSTGEYVVITDDSNIGLFTEVENIISVPSFDVLTNTGEAVVLKDQFSNTVDSISYDLRWYRDADKSGGGYALELIDPLQRCSDESNWQASTDVSGGTPGSQNSVFDDSPDATPPTLVSVEVIEGDALQVSFSEPVDESTISASDFSISGYSISGLEQLSFSTYLVFLATSLRSEHLVELTVSDVSDCHGNTLTSEVFDFYYDITAPVLNRLVILSENELALVFHEALKEKVAEREANYSLEGFTVARALLQDSSSSRVHVSFEEVFREGVTYRLNVEPLQDTLGNSATLASIDFTFLDEIDTVSVVAPNLLEVDFAEAPLVSAVLTGLNYSVNGEMRPVEVIPDDEDSTIFRLAFEENFKANKELPLYVEGLVKASDNEPLITPAFTFSLDTRPPGLTALSVPNGYQLVLTFNEKIDPSSAVSSALYHLEDGDHPEEVMMISEAKIRLTFSDRFEIGKEKRLTYTGIKDMAGNALTANRNVRFVYDPRPPEVLDATLLNDTAVQVSFSEKIDSISAITLTNYELDTTNPDAVSILGPDSTDVELSFENISFSESSELVVQNISDKKGNRLTEQTITLDSFSPALIRLTPVSDTRLVVSFNKQMSGSARSVANYFLEGLDLAGVTEIDASNYLLEVSEVMDDGDSILLSTSDLESQERTVLSVSEISAVFKTYLEGVRIVDDKTILLDFESPFTFISKSQFQMEENTITLALPDGADKSVVRLVLESSLKANIQESLSWSGLGDAYHRTIPDHSINIVLDTDPPALINVESEYFGVLTLTFSEKLEENTATSINHYQILSVGEPVSAKMDNNALVILDFNDALETGQTYQLVTSGLSDLSDNFSMSDTLEFVYNTPLVPRPGEIIITELMIDPGPSSGLPEAEYIELYNLSKTDYDLRSLKIGDASVKTFLPDHILRSQDYMVLVDEGDASLFEGSDIVEVDDLPSLNNAGDILVLETIFGTEINTVEYTIDWYGDIEKDDGGYSLELINPFSECPGIVNWKASINEKGGTPGYENSVYSLTPDVEAPIVRSFEVVDTETVQLTFNEAMDSLSLLFVTLEIAEPGIADLEISGSVNEVLTIQFDQDILAGVVYQLTVSDALDCAGNKMVPVTFSFGDGERPGFNELIITEIMADPEPVLGLPNSEYLELYNVSDKLISLESILLHDAAGQTALPAVTIGAGEYLLLTPASSVSAFEVFNRIGVSGWLSLSNGGESLSLTYEDELIFQVRYSSDWHSSADKEEGGFSLEMRDAFNPCAGTINWGSSISPSGGTPGQANSISESVPDNFGPNLISSFTFSADSIMLMFDEGLTPGANELAKITIEPATGIETIYQSLLKREELVLKLSGSLTVNQPCQISVSGVTDCNGNPLRNNRASFVLPDQPDSLDVIINEVLFNPKPGGVDFVELYNNSDAYFDLNGWQLARLHNGQMDPDPISEIPFLFAPGEYLALTTDTITVKSQYTWGVERQFIRMRSFPALPNEEGTVVLITPGERISDQFTYSEDFHLSLLENVDGVSLERISFNDPTQDENNWSSAAASVGFATPGYANSQAFEAAKSNAKLRIDPKVFVPGSTNAAQQTFTTINYQFSKNGQFANVSVFNQLGQPVAQLAKGASLSTSGFLRWDGTDASGSIVRMGYYVVLFEVYDGNGNRQALKETVVVGR